MFAQLYLVLMMLELINILKPKCINRSKSKSRLKSNFNKILDKIKGVRAKTLRLNEKRFLSLDKNTDINK
ncbi:hypothetical protein BpHYR1_022626 [Brachionus plicatilis]|uniref:Uncharacterized protein n=1 Tax=Brachionus plicatilis TaxID=10195 RepID=A0A3M7R055_BRAPC|nr:hypothetical protein BpHYR1_022626 [Brachionus plicatilis]